MAEYIFHGDLRLLLRPKWRQKKTVVQQVTRSASIKDVIESFGLPHTEVGKIDCHGRAVAFSHPVEPGQQFDIHPVPVPYDVTVPSFLRPSPLGRLCFIVDVNVGRLARYLRMSGFDTLYAADMLKDMDISGVLANDPRMVLSRDFNLLKRRVVVFGRYIRSIHPPEQLREVLQLFGIENQVKPLSRCLECNSLLKPVRKADIRYRLEPLTDKYFHRFSLCARCDKLYWAGSHVENMMGSFKELGRGHTLLQGHNRR